MRKMGRKFVSALMATVLVMTSADFSALRVNAETENVLEISEDETSELEEAAEEEIIIETCETENEVAETEVQTEADKEKSTIETESEQIISESIESETNIESLLESEETETQIESPTSNDEVEVMDTLPSASGQCGDNLTWTLEDGVLTISGTGDMRHYLSTDVSGEGDWVTDAPWGEYYDQVITLVLGEGITSIGECAFEGCSGLTGELIIPNSVTSIGEDAFSGCSGFTGNLTIPNSVTEIEHGAFSDCSGFTGNLIIPNSVTEIGGSAFEGCSGFTGNLIIPNSVTEIEYGAFHGCSGFTGNLIIPNSVTEIEGAFYGCSGFTGNLIIPNSVTSIGSCAFSECSGFTGNLTIPNSVTEIGEWAFGGCSGFTGNLIIPNSVTEIGEGAFGGCSGFTGNLTIPNSVTSIGGSAFSLCSGFTGNLIIPNSVTEIGEGAFDFCSGFTGNLTIPNSVTSIGNWAFIECRGLTDIYLSSNIQLIGEIAFHKMNEEFTDYVPLNVTIHCPLDSYAYNWAVEQGFKVDTSGAEPDKPAEPGEPTEPTEPTEPDKPKVEDLLDEPVQVSKDKATICIFDFDDGKVMASTEVEIDGKTYTTDSTGRISIAATDEWKYVDIKIKASGYQYFDKKEKVKNGMYTLVLMRHKSDNTAIIDVRADVGDKSYSLMSEKMVLGYKEDISTISEASKKPLSIYVDTTGFCSKYEIINEDGEVILSSSSSPITTEAVVSGIFEGSDFSTDTPITSIFEPKEKYYVRVTQGSAKKSVVPIGISPTFNYMTAERQFELGEFSLGEKIELTIPEDVPLIGNSKIEFDFSEDFPLEIMTDGEGVVRIAYNMPADVDFEEFSKDYKELEKRAKNQSKDFLKDLKASKKIGAGFFDADFKICGYGEGNLSESYNGNLTIKLGILGEITGEGGYKHYFMAGVVPVNVFIKGKATGKVTVEEEIVIENCKVTDIDISGGNINIIIEINPGAGVGVGLELNASLTGSLNYIWKPARKYHKVWTELSGKISVVAFLWEKTLWQGRNYTKTIYESSKDIKPYSNEELSSLSDEGFEPVNRSYLDYASGYLDNDSIQLFEETSNNKVVVKPAIYPAAVPKLVEVKGIKYLFWLEDIASREANNRLAIVYAVSADGNNWSEPKRVLEEAVDNTLDVEYNVFVENNKIYIIWQDAIREIDENDDMLSTASSLMVRSAVIDVENGEITDKGIITTKSGYYMYPVVAVAGGEAYYAYVENELDSKNILGNNRHHLYLVKEGDKQTEVNLPQNAQIINMKADTFTAEPYIICELDTDGNIATDTDREIYSISMKNGDITNISQNTVCDTMPDIANSGCIYWYQDGNITKSNGPKDTGKNIWTEPHLTDNVLVKAITDNTGRDILIWESVSSDTNDGSVSVYNTCENEDGTWTAVTKCADTAGTIPSKITGIWSGNDVLLAHLEGTFLEDGTMLKDLVVFGRKENTDIAVDYVEYDEKEAIPSAKLPFTVYITNNGNTIINQAEFLVNNNLVESKADLNLQPGESREIVINGFTVPENLSCASNYKLTVNVNGDSNSSDNEQSFILGSPDFYVEKNIRLYDGSTWLDFGVYNDSVYASSGTVKVHKGSEEGEVIFEKKFETINKEEGYAYAVDLSSYEAEETRYYIEVIADCEERSVGDNIMFVYIGYGTGIDIDVTSSEESEDLISEISLDKTEIALKVGESTKITAKSNLGDKWNSDELVWTSTDKTIASVDKEGVVTAYRNGSTIINAYYGDLQASCTVYVNDNRQKLLTVSFDTQGADEISAITNILPGETILLPTNIAKDGYLFGGWYTQAEGGEKIESDSVIVEHSMVLYAHWESPKSENGFWIQDIPEQVYTGKAIKPEIKVYDGAVLLNENKDYTISYKNNTKANDASVAKTAPTIIVKGKGNYSGTEKATFKILPLDLNDTSIEVDDITLAYNKKVQKPVPVVTFNGKKLKNKKDFAVSYPALEKGEMEAFKKVGSYDIIISGKKDTNGNYTGNFKGERTIKLNITDSILISKASVKKIPNQNYKNGTAVEPVLTIKMKGNPDLVKGKDYTIQFKNNTKIGTATAIVKGIGKYAGTKTVSFKIVGKAFNTKNVNITGIEDKEYNSQYQTLSLQVIPKDSSIPLKEGKDYEVNYMNNKNAGTASVAIKGINNYSGTITKTFRITSFDMAADSQKAVTDKALSGLEKEISMKYVKGGAKPKLKLRFKGVLLEEGKDYSISYQNNKAVADSNSEKAPLIIIKGKGNFKGTIKKQFTITSKSLDDKTSPVTLNVADIGFVDKAGKYKSKPVLTDADGSKLVAGKDYEKDIVYSLLDGTILDNNRKPEAGTFIKVTVTGKGNYAGGTLEGTYCITKNDFNKAKIIISPQVYTGKEIVLDKNAFKTVKIGGVDITDAFGTDYEIVEGSYKNNINKGIASVTIKGKGNYGGTKTVNFKIMAKQLKWFEKLFG